MRDVQPAYFTFKQAAAYLGYGESTFREYVRTCSIPRCGPRGNRFRKADLDAFMENPFVFASPVRVRRPRSGFTPVAI